MPSAASSALDLEAIKRNFPGYPYPDLLRTIEVSVEALERADRERYLDLAVFPEDQPIPEEALRVLWNLDEADTRDCMTRLVARSLATWATDGTSLILHDLQRDLIHKRREKDLAWLALAIGGSLGCAAETSGCLCVAVGRVSHGEGWSQG